MSTRLIRIAYDFSRFPSGRFRADGDFSGEAFRDDILAPALACSRFGDIVEVEFDGTLGYGSSFLEEAFGELHGRCGLTQDEIISRLRIISLQDPSLVTEAWSYVLEGWSYASGRNTSRKVIDRS